MGLCRGCYHHTIYTVDIEYKLDNVRDLRKVGRRYCDGLLSLSIHYATLIPYITVYSANTTLGNQSHIVDAIKMPPR